MGTHKKKAKVTFRVKETPLKVESKPVIEIYRTFEGKPEEKLCRVYPDKLNDPGTFFDMATNNPADLSHLATAEAYNYYVQNYGTPKQAVPVPAPVPPKPVAPVQPQPKIKSIARPAVAKQVDQPSKAASPPAVNYQAKCDSLEGTLELKEDEIKDLRRKLAGKTAKVDTLDKQLTAAKKTGAGVTDKELEARLQVQKHQLLAQNEQDILDVHNNYQDILDGKIVRYKNKNVELKVGDLWVHRDADGKFYGIDKDGAEVVYTPKLPQDFESYFVAAEQAVVLRALQRNLKAKQNEAEVLSKKLAKAKKQQRVAPGLEGKVDDLPTYTYEESTSHVQNIATGTVATILSSLTGYLVESGHFLENVFQNYIPGVSWLADQVHQADPNNYAGAVLGGLIGLGLAYKFAMSGTKQAPEPVAVQAPVVKPVPAAEMPKPELPAAPVAPQTPQVPVAPKMKTYKVSEVKVSTEEFE